MQTLIQRDSKPWLLQVWVSFLIAVFLCAVGLSWLPGRDLGRAFMVMGYMFCLSAAFVLAKYVRDQEKAGKESGRGETPMFKLVVWAGFFLAMHHKPYSIVSYAWGRKYQQSNQWAIETLAAALDPRVNSRERAQAWLHFKGYEPTVLRLGPLTRLGGRMTAANVAFDDHPGEKRYSERIETVTVDSVFDWLRRVQLTASGKPPAVVRL